MVAGPVPSMLYRRADWRRYGLRRLPAPASRRLDLRPRRPDRRSPSAPRGPSEAAEDDSVTAAWRIQRRRAIASAARQLGASRRARPLPLGLRRGRRTSSWGSDDAGLVDCRGDGDRCLPRGDCSVWSDRALLGPAAPPTGPTGLAVVRQGQLLPRSLNRTRFERPQVRRVSPGRAGRGRRVGGKARTGEGLSRARRGDGRAWSDGR